MSLFVVLLALWFRPPNDEVLDERLDTVLSSLLRAERKVMVDDVARPRVAVFGGCVDLIVDAVSLLKKIGLPPTEQPLHHDYIENAEQLTQSFAFFFAPGAAARFMLNETLFSELVESSRDLPGNRWSVGGNAPVMAARMAAEGCEVLLGGSFSPDFTDVLSQHITVTGNTVEEPDIHLILEYPSGASWGQYTARRANYIIHSDDHNPYLASMEEFGKNLEDFKPDLMVVGGLQMMDNFPLGMNEQELPNLLSLLKGSNITVLSDPNPRVATVLDQMREVYRLLNQRSSEMQIAAVALTRLHVHTLAFQAIIVTRGSRWKNTMSATAKASLTANRHVCGSDDIDPNKARLIMDDSFSISRREGSQRIPLQESRPVSCWDEEDYEICVAPVLVCTEVYQTAGGGDNISAAGLVLQI
uniref:ADP-dependent glucokinase 2 n=1 Tax=Cynoglossus semilaevis TaxID=244447 RepID=A0A3P8W644_CYNSE